MRIYCLLAGMALFVSGCMTSASTDLSELDIPLTTDRRVTPPPSNEHGVAVVSEDEIGWQQFFKQSPTASERSFLEQTLKSQTTKLSVSELINRGRNQMAIGRTADAEISFREAARRDPGNLSVILDLAQLYIHRDDLTMSFEFLAQGKKLIDRTEKPNSTEVFRYRYILAIAYIKRGDYDLGHRVLGDLVAIDRTFAPGYAALATSYLQSGRNAIAEFIAKRGIDRAGDSPGLFNVLGVTAMEANRLGEARQMFDRALELDRNYAQAMVNRAHLSIKNFDYEAAEMDLSKAIEANPNSAEAFVALGILHRRQGLASRSREAFEKALVIAPTNAPARMNLALLLAEDLNDEHTALQLFYEVVQITKEGSSLRSTAQRYIDQIHHARHL